MALWARVTHDGRECFGTVEGDTLRVQAGDMLANPQPTGESIPFGAAKLLTPTTPSKMVALVDNYHALVAKLNHAVPAEPLYFLKAGNSFLAGGETIRAPGSYAGKVVYEGELGIVIGKIEIITRDPGFAQWTRAKSFDSFGVFGPVIATGVDPAKLVVKTILNAQERQSYPVSDIIFAPARLVSLISHDMTLEAGDVIACGTSTGVGSMKPGSTVSIVIDGIGALTNRFE